MQVFAWTLLVLQTILALINLVMAVRAEDLATRAALLVMALIVRVPLAAFLILFILKF